MAGLSLNVSYLSEKQESDYERFLLSEPTALIYASPLYQKFLLKTLKNCEPLYLIASNGNQIVGALPSFVCNNQKIGPVVNSLPFFGSNGGLIISQDVPNKDEIRKSLLDAFFQIAETKSVVSSTLISNPLDEGNSFYEEKSAYTYRDERIGQISTLPNYTGDESLLEEELLSLFHRKTRNHIRKAQKSQLNVSHSDSLEALKSLSTMHQENMGAIQGTSKPWSVFTDIRNTFTYDRDYRVYLAQRNGITIAALLVFFYNQSAEYFIPATKEEYRIYQPVSLLIFEAMKEACRRGCRYWNWGGTWMNQSGVFDFKNRWGTTNRPYYYYTKIYDRTLMQTTKSELLAEYPYFYVVPFSSLASGKKEDL